ncbi:MAG: FecR domain-containing protein [Chitinophagaceae bacterium]|nr:FecR domain-containing protein [Chitinophagaceae bacterium]
MNENLHTDPGSPSGIHEDLLVKHLLGETGPEENARVEAWLAAHPANRHYYEHFRLIWRESRQLDNNFRETDEQTDIAWQKFRRRIHRPPHLKAIKNDPVPTPEPKRSFPVWTRIAAIFLLVVSITAVLYFINTGTAAPEKRVASTTTTLTDTLPDGSLITLNKQSAIKYPENFKKERTVQLKGEAFFAIAPDKKRPFHVYTNGVTITVLGTSFNVRDRDTATEIIVETGQVRVTDSLHNILLHASERLILRKGDLALSKDSTRNELYKYYRTKEFVCDDTPLWQLAASLEEAYNVKIEIADPQLRELRINTTFRDVSLDQILSVIHETFRIKVSRSGDQVILQY